MKKTLKTIGVSVMAAVLLFLTGCRQEADYSDFVFPQQEKSSLVPVSDLYTDTPAVYDSEGIPDRLIETFSSDDGVCVIKKMEHYYDVTIDYENATPSQAGKAYAQALIKAFPEFHALADEYLYENIVWAFPGLRDDYSPVIRRINTLVDSLREEYREELISFAEELSGGLHVFAEDGMISYEEALTFNLVPEALRDTACSALSLWGSKTESGDALTVRFLDWGLGSKYQMGQIHAVMHAKKADRSYMGFSFLGILGTISAINDDGVFAAILDARSGEAYSYENKKCYTYELRYALEEFDTAEQIGQYMVANSADFTISHNIVITDGEHSFCAEDADAALQSSGKGYSVLRDCHTPLLEGLHWDHEDSLCIVNSFATRDNFELFSYNSNNAVRFLKYNEWLGEKDSFSTAELKTLITRERVNQGKAADESYADNVRNEGNSQIILIDYHTGRVQVSFTGPEGPSDQVLFTDVGEF